MRRSFLSITALVFLVAAPAAGEAADAVKITSVERADRLLTLELNTPGGPLLDSDRFQVFVNGIPATGVTADVESTTESAGGVVLVVDTSGSMEGAPMAAAKTAIRAFLDEIETTTEVALVGFSDSARILSPFTADRSKTQAAVARLTARGETALYDGVLQGLKLIKDRSTEQRNIVVLSDGADTASRTGSAAVLATAKSTDARIFSVALESPEFSAEALGSLSRKTGGTLLRTSDSAELSGLFEDLASTLASSYELSFTDPDPFASRLDITVIVDGEGSALQGLTSIDLAVVADSGSGTVRSSFLNVPLPLLVLGVFLIVAVVFFTVTDLLRSSRKSPLRRLPWYVAKKEEKSLDPTHFVNAAVVKRAQEIATSMAGKAGYLERLDRDIDAAALRWKAGEILVTAFLMGVGGLVLGALLKGLPGAVLLALLGSFGVLARVKMRASKRRKAFYEQLPDVLILLSGSLRAGYSLQQAIMAVGEDAQPPASEEFKRAMAEVRLGSSADDSLKALALRIGISDVDWTVQAIQIHNEVGGNLAEILETIAGTIRERARVKRQLNALTAEGKLSGLILGVLPFVLLGLVLLVNKTYLEPLFSTMIGWLMMGGSLGMMLIGFAWMRQIIRIEV